MARVVVWAASANGAMSISAACSRTARAVLVAAHRRKAAAQPLTRLHHWALTVRDRRGHSKATIAVANKRGRTVWAVWQKNVPFAVPDALTGTGTFHPRR